MGRQGLGYRAQVFSTAYHIGPNTLFFPLGRQPCPVLSCLQTFSILLCSLLDKQFTCLSLPNWDKTDMEDLEQFVA